MIRVALALPLVLGLSFCEGDKAPKASDQTSPNGTPYRLIQMPGNDYAAILAAWPNDWVWAEGRNPTASYIGAQLILAGGAEDYPAGEVVERFADMDANGELPVSADHLYGLLAAKKADWPEAIAIANAHLTQPSFDPDWFDRIRTGFAQNIAEAQSQPMQQGFDALRWAILGDHPLRAMLSLDDPDAFASLSLDDLRAWHSATVTAQPEAVVITGDITPEQAGAGLDTLLARLPERESQLREIVLDYRPRQILLHLPDSEEAHLTFIAPLPATRLGGDLEDLILATALGGGEDSVLFASVRDGLRASYSFSAGLGNYTRETRFLVMTGALESAKLADAVDVVRDAYAGFRDTGPDGDINDRKAPWRQAFERNSDYVIDLGMVELEATLDGFPTGHSLNIIDMLDALTAADLRNRLQGHWPHAQDFVIMAVSPDAAALPGACVITRPEDAKDC
ncbi:M16 family metallopeptidase [Roseinatronobacter alkalisoli]|uniref:Insulinase family protein n=1 Tax=Roseinatronobacter alkalisoli TaxID=3028235 RepID=A0ABT5TIN7_9RHOB|nr:insulinase family protein [Roseinatronobacter sp. HJB301]MDD7973818.1 insulinase family protein [Roseinatronobacter sp. HJB301]